MTIIANAFKTFFAAIGLTCAILVGLFVYSAYHGGGEEIAKWSCAVRTTGVAEYSSCMYQAGVSLDN